MKTTLSQNRGSPALAAWYNTKGAIMSIIRPKIICWLALAALCSSLEASTYYVDFVSGSDSNTSTQAKLQTSPWKHMPGMSGATSNANSYAVQSGDVFVLKGGVTWTFTAKNEDLITVPASNITIMGGQQLSTPWGAGYPVLDGSGSTITIAGIYSSGKSSVTIDGLKIFGTCHVTDGSGFGINVLPGGCSNWDIKNCYLDSCGVNAMSFQPGNGASHFLFHSNVVVNCGRVYMACDPGVAFDDAQFYNNDMRGPGTWNALSYHGDGFMIGSSSNTNPSLLTNVQVYGNKFSGDWSQGATALIFLNNAGVGASSWTVGAGYHAKIYNNQVCMDSKGWVSPSMIMITNGWRDVQVYNNTVNAGTAGGTAVAMAIMETTNTSELALVVKNNIFSGCTWGGQFDDVKAGAGLTMDYNLWQTTGNNHYIQDSRGSAASMESLAAMQSGGYEAHGVVVTSASAIGFAKLPNGTNGAGDWHILSTSPAIGKGDSTILQLINNIDCDGNPRVASDIGAYAYNSGSVTGIVAPSNAVLAILLQ